MTTDVDDQARARDDRQRRGVRAARARMGRARARDAASEPLSPPCLARGVGAPLRRGGGADRARGAAGGAARRSSSAARSSPPRPANGALPGWKAVRARRSAPRSRRERCDRGSACSAGSGLRRSARRVRPAHAQPSRGHPRLLARRHPARRGSRCSTSAPAGRRSTRRRRARRSGTCTAAAGGSSASSAAWRSSSPATWRSFVRRSRRLSGCTTSAGKGARTDRASPRRSAAPSSVRPSQRSPSSTCPASFSSSWTGARSPSTTTSPSRGACTCTGSPSTRLSPASLPVSSTRWTRSRPPSEEGLTRVEFLGGAERYKTELADGFEPLCHGLGLATGARARAVVAARLGVIRLRLRVKRSPTLHRLYMDGVAPVRRLTQRSRDALRA